MKNKREQAKAKVEFKIHLFIFIAVIGLLAVINLVIAPETLWFIWPFFGWGIGVIAHALSAYYSLNLPSVKERMIEKEMNE